MAGVSQAPSVPLFYTVYNPPPVFVSSEIWSGVRCSLFLGDLSRHHLPQSPSPSRLRTSQPYPKLASSTPRAAQSQLRRVQRSDLFHLGAYSHTKPLPQDANKGPNQLSALHSVASTHVRAMSSAATLKTLIHAGNDMYVPLSQNFSLSS